MKLKAEEGITTKLKLEAEKSKIEFM